MIWHNKHGMEFFVRNHWDLRCQVSKKTHPKFILKFMGFYLSSNLRPLYSILYNLSETESRKSGSGNEYGRSAQVRPCAAVLTPDFLDTLGQIDKPPSTLPSPYSLNSLSKTSQDSQRLPFSQPPLATLLLLVTLARLSTSPVTARPGSRVPYSDDTSETLHPPFYSLTLSYNLQHVAFRKSEYAALHLATLTTSPRHWALSLTQAPLEFGVGFLLSSVLFFILGIFLFFDRACLSMANILFLIGITLTLGPRRTLSFFATKEKYRGTVAFFVGICLILAKWTIVGLLIECYGVIGLFGDMFGVVAGFIGSVPVVGPPIENVLRKVTGATQSLPV